MNRLSLSERRPVGLSPRFSVAPAVRSRRSSLALLAAALPLMLGAVACGGAGAAGEGEDVAELRARAPGIELAGAGGLTLSLRYQLDRTDTTLKAFDRKIVVKRGAASFDGACSVGGVVGGGRDEVSARCVTYTSEVSPNEQLEFTLLEKRGDYSITDVSLRGHDLETERDVLTGGARSPVPLSVTYASTDPKKNLFAAGARAKAALEPLIGTKVFAAKSETERTLKRIPFQVDEYLGVSGNLEFATGSPDGFLSFRLVKDQFDVTSALLTDAQLADAIRAALPHAPSCTDGPAAGGNVGNAIRNAVTPLEGPLFGLAHETTLANLPAAVRAKARAAQTEIRGRGFSGTDYSADVAGIYAIQASCGDATVVGYAIWGTGTGEPDYHDGIVIGWDETGREVAREEDSG